MVSFGFSNYVNFFSLLQELIERIHVSVCESSQSVEGWGGVDWTGDARGWNCFDFANVGLTNSSHASYGDGKRSIEILFDGHEGRISL